MGYLNWVSSASPPGEFKDEAPADSGHRKDERVALCVIAGDDAIEQGFERMLESAKDQFAGLYVSYNGADMTPVVKAIMKAGVREGCIGELPWGDDFAEARNHSFYLAEAQPQVEVDSTQPTAAHYDWLFWLDCDDVLPETFDIQAIIGEARRRRYHGVLLPYNYDIAANGDVLAKHYKERLFRADTDWLWEYPIHEVCHGAIATRLAKIDLAGQYVDHRRGGGDKRQRNRAIIAKWFRENPDDPRAQMFMAHEIFAEAEAMVPFMGVDGFGVVENMVTTKNKLYVEAFKLYSQVADGTVDDDGYHATLQAARCLRALGRSNDAVNRFLQALKMHPSWATPSVEIATTFFGIEQYDLAIEWATAALNVAKEPDSLHVVEVLDDAFRPHVIIGQCREAQGRTDLAVASYYDALAFHFDQSLDDHAAKLTERIDNPLVSIADDGDAMILPEDPKKLREKLWGTKPEKSIAFWTNPHFEPWDEKTLARNGLGGTESSIIALAKRFVDAGWRAIIFGTPETEGIHEDGVEWWSAGRYHPDEPLTAFVAVRAPEMLLSPNQAQTQILWLHDVTLGPNVDDAMWDAADIVVCPSSWHRQHTLNLYPGLDEKKVVVISNGIEHARFNEQRISSEGERSDSTFIYASSPDRGLLRLLALWPQTKRLVPDAKLDIYYGWESIDAIIANDLPTAHQLKHFKKVVKQKIHDLGGEGDASGIYWKGRVNQNELAYALSTATAILYPADFLETFGIIFAQAAAAGCPSVVPALGNLDELAVVLGTNEFIVPGQPNSEAFEAPFLEAVAETRFLTCKDSEWISTSAGFYDWENVFPQWVNTIIRSLANKEKS